MRRIGLVRYRLSRTAGRLVTTTAAALTLGTMPPFVSASVIVIERDRLLLVIDPIRREATLPGGHLKWAESPTDAAVREAREETGYAVSVNDLFGVYSGQIAAGERGVVRIVYTATIVGGTLQSSGEGEATWMPVDTYSSSEARDAPIIRELHR